jgi:hypothetical protein
MPCEHWKPEFSPKLEDIIVDPKVAELADLVAGDL